MKMASELNNRMLSLFATAESYPELKASEQFLNLQQKMAKMENQLQAARRAYNMSVTDMNIAIETFPSSLIAGMFGIQKGDFFESNDNIAENIKTGF